MLTQGIAAQGLSESTFRFAAARSSRVDELFQMRSSLIMKNASTREVDMELAELGVRFPAKVNLANLGGRISIAFFLIEESEATRMIRKLERLKSEITGLEYIGVDSYNNYCYATFERGTPDSKIESLLHEFMYDGFYVSNPTSMKLGVLR